jgi:hypothetical protein
MTVSFRTTIVAKKCYYRMLGLLRFFSSFKKSHRPSYNILLSPLLEFVSMHTVDNTIVSDIMSFWNVTR